MRIQLGLTLALACAAPVSAQTPVTPPPVAVTSPGRAPVDLADVWLVIYNVQPTRTEAFEALATRVHGAMRTSPDERRRRQAATLRILRSALPNPDGNVVYFVQVPTEPGNDAERTGLDVLIDAVLPSEATAVRAALDSTLDPRNPSGNALMLAIR